MRTWRALFLLLWVGAAVAQTTPPAAAGAASSDPSSAAGPPAAPESGPAQPIAFSHKIHAGTGQLPCETCHTASRSGESLTMPQAKVCMQCHQAIATDKPEIQKLTEYAKENRPIPWVRVYEVPSFVSFSHKVHLEHGNTCVECHGPVPERTTISKETDISMAGCMGCHKAKNAASGCSTCHLLDQSRLGGSGPADGWWEARTTNGGETGGAWSLRRFLTTLDSAPESGPLRAHRVAGAAAAGRDSDLFRTLFD